MKTWPQWHELWTALESEVRAPCPPFTASKDWALVIAKIEEREQETREAVDRACRRWAREYLWPKRMTGEVRWFVHLRVVGAVTNAVTLMQPHRGRSVFEPAAGITEEMLNEWFLIDAWPCAWGRMRAELRNGGAEPPRRFAPSTS